MTGSEEGRRALAGVLLAALVALVAPGCASTTSACAACDAWNAGPEGVDRALPGEHHLRNVQQFTFGGENAEAYWSFDDRYLIFQSTRDDLGCDQIFTLELATGEVVQLTNEGRTTCAYFLPGSDRVLFASTHATSPDCPPVPDRSMGYVWPLYPGYEIYTAERDGSGLVNITNSGGYDAEATVSRDGRIVFTSDRSGDLELWSMESDGSDLRQLTDTPGYDGGAFFSRDGSKLVWRASRFDDPETEREYFRLLGRGIVRPSEMEIFVADADGGNARQLTDNGAANFAPFFTPDGRSILFSSNVGDPGGRIFDIWKIGVDGTGLEQVTHNGESFDGFPMFSWCGAKLAFSSNRNAAAPYDTNVFVAEWRP